MTATDTPPENLRELIKGIRFAMLTTRDATGVLHSRPMATQEDPGNDTLWFFTGKSTHKATDIAANPLVNLSYSDPASNRYISVCGRAEIVADHTRMRALWIPSFATWFPQGVDDPELALLKITVEHIDFWHSPATWMARTLAFAKMLATGDPTSLAQQGSVAIQPHGAGRIAQVNWALLLWATGIPMCVLFIVAVMRGYA